MRWRWASTVQRSCAVLGDFSMSMLPQLGTRAALLKDAFQCMIAGAPAPAEDTTALTNLGKDLCLQIRTL